MMWTALVFFLLLLGLPVLELVQIPVRLMVGWVPFLWDSFSEMAVRWEMVISCLVALFIAVSLLHVACRWGMSRIGNSCTWGWRSTVAVTVAMMVLFTASFVVTGVGHQVLWLKRGEMTQMNSIGRVLGAVQIVTAANRYARDHGGRFPDSLEELASDFSQPGFIERLGSFNERPQSEKELWTYLGSGMTHQMPSHLPLIISPRPVRFTGKYDVVQVDGVIQRLAPAAFHQLMDEWRKSMREVGATPSVEKK